MLRRSRGYVPAEPRAPAGGAAAAGLRRRAEEHLLPGQGRAAPGWATTSATCSNWETLRSFREGIEHFERLFAVAPEVVAHDLHPEYLSTSTRWSARG